MRVLTTTWMLLFMTLSGCAAHLPIVHTYADLLAQQPIVVPAEPPRSEGTKSERQIVTLRLGQSALSAPIHSAVILYCFTEDFDLFASPENIDRLGPLWVSVTHESGLNFDSKAQKSPFFFTHGWETTKDAKLLFMRTVMIDRPGIYHIAFKTIDGKIIAQTSVIGIEGSFQPWLPFNLVKLGKWGGYELKRTDETFENLAPIEVSFPGYGAALPQLSNQTELYGGEYKLRAIGEIGKHRPSDPLPTLIAEKPTLKLDKAGDLFTVTDPELMYNSRLDYAYLSRWWVNGKPFVPPDGRPKLEDGPILDIGHKSLPFILHLDPAVIGAKPGDVVSLQLLQCESWDFVSNPPQGGSGVPGKITNRISWVIPPPVTTQPSTLSATER